MALVIQLGKLTRKGILNMESKLQEITLGETVCEKLRSIYHPSVPWVECHNSVSQRYGALKAKARKLYVDKSEIEVLMELAKYSEADIKDLEDHCST
jgi:hypothetical protein